MLQPKRTKFRKTQKGRNRGLAQAGNKVSFGEFGLGFFQFFLFGPLGGGLEVHVGQVAMKKKRTRGLHVSLDRQLPGGLA